jgi:2-keto-4-pentenoate hydratase/2-oxohepta-3-ene-1,7-dioic acid hydratase in catechol pathway
MRMIKFSRGGMNAEGFLEGDDVYAWGDWRRGPADEAPFELSRLAPDALAAARGAAKERLPRSEVKLALPVDFRAKIICIGRNYLEHLAEAGAPVEGERPPQPALFTKEMDALVGPEDALVCPKASHTYDYEGELAVVIGRSARHISPSEASAYIGGYTCFMDGSVREYQEHSASAGKNFWRSGALGPEIVTPDEAPGIGAAGLVTRVNGDVLQSSSTDRMIFSVDEIISYCSRWTRLNPGDVIATGTPAGVGLFRDPPLWLKPGDEVEVEIAGVGVLRNRVAAE